jgi:putative ABC transport system ATP-binding protein
MATDLELSATFAALRYRQVALRAKGLRYWFGEGETRTQVLDGIQLEIGRGEVVILTGPSGSGKTTLLTLIGGLRHVQEGSLLVLGREMASLPPAELVAQRQKIGFIFQNHNLFSSLSAIENVRMATALHPEGVTTMNRKAESILDRLGLGSKLSSFPGRLSGGQRQRVAIARALVNHPELILADEPTASLDAASGQEVLSLLHEMADSPSRSTVLIVTHDQRVLDRADRIVNLVSGKIVSNVRPEISVRIVKLLQQTEELHDFSQNVPALTRVADQMVVEHYHQGERIVRQGTKGKRWCLIGQGSARVLVDDQEVKSLGEGDSFGVITQITEHLHPATIIADSDLEAFVLTDEALDRIMTTDPSIEAHVKRELMNRQ